MNELYSKFENASDLIDTGEFDEALRILLEISESEGIKSDNDLLIMTYGGIALCYSDTQAEVATNVYIDLTLNAINNSCSHGEKIKKYKNVLPILVSSYMSIGQYKECYRMSKLYISLFNNEDEIDTNVIGLIKEVEEIIFKI